MTLPVNYPRQSEFSIFKLASSQPGRRLALAAHETLFAEGDEADFLYTVLSGVLCSYQVLPDGRRLVLSFFYPGDIVGLVRSSAHRYSCEASCPSEVRSISRAGLLYDAQRFTEIGKHLLEVAANELDLMQEHQLLLGRRSATEKLATFLMNLATRSGCDGSAPFEIRVPMTRTDIADFLGMTIETVSRNLTKLKVKKIIELPNYDSIVVREPDVLRALASGTENLG